MDRQRLQSGKSEEGNTDQACHWHTSHSTLQPSIVLANRDMFSAIIQNEVCLNSVVATRPTKWLDNNDKASNLVHH